MSKKGREDLDDMEKELEDAHEESKSRKEGSGKFGTIFKDDLDVPRWKCKNGEHVIDIIPYRAGKFDPNRPEGKAAYFLDLYVHKNVGLTNDSFVCPSRNYKKRCPICEEIKRLADKGVEYEEYKDDVPKRVNIYNIICYDSTEEEDKGIQIWDVPNFFMEDKLRGLAKNKRTGEPIYYASPKRETGRSIAFERKGKGKGNVEFLSHEFLKRDYDISKDIIEQAVCLDEAINQSSYEEIYEAYYGKPYSEKKKRDEEDDEPKSKRSRRSNDDDDDDKPSERKRKRQDDDDDDDRPKRKSKSDDDLECPAKGGVFGEDCDTLKECKKCEVWDDCAKKHDELESKSSSKSKKKNDDDEDEPPKKKKRSDDDDDDDKPRKKSRRDEDDD